MSRKNRLTIMMAAAQRFAQIKDKYILSMSKCHEIRRGMIKDMTIGLETNGENSSCKMLESRVMNLPNGNEKGIYYAIDWGGSNVRFIRVELSPNNEPVIDSIKYKIPKQLQTCDNVDDLFNFLAENFKSLMQKYNEYSVSSKQSINKIFSVGFTFSFPIKQPSLNKGILLQWTKGFNIKGVAGKDIVSLMNDAFRRYTIPARVDAICNDTVGTLISCSYQHKNTMIGIIIGTGTNAAYVEPAKDNEVINIEWGNFDEKQEYLPRVDTTDIFMDSYTVNQGEYLAEKMLSGMYAGEICRLLMLEIFKEKIPERAGCILLDRFGEFSGYQVTILLRAYYNNGKYYGVKRIMEILRGDKYRLNGFDEDDVMVMIEIFKLIMNRSADLAACLLLGVLEKCGFYRTVSGGDGDRYELCQKWKRDFITVGIDGGVFLNMPQYPQRIRKTMVDMVGEEIVNRIRIDHAEDGSGKGAALCVAAAQRNDGIISKL